MSLWSEPKKYHINKRWKINRLTGIRDYETQFVEAQASDVSIIFSGEGLSLLNLRSLAELTERSGPVGLRFVLWLWCGHSDYAIPLPSNSSRWSHLELVECGLARTSANASDHSDGQRELTRMVCLWSHLQLVPFRRACAHSHGPVGYLLEEFVVFLILRWSSFRIPRNPRAMDGFVSKI